MSPGTQVLLSGALTFGVPLVLAIRELIALRRSPGGSWGPNGSAEPEPPPAPRGTGPAVKPLPACLIPVRRPDLVGERRVRVLERV